MIILRASLLALFAAHASIVLADPLLPDPLNPSLDAAAPTAEPAGRKGTRAYRPGEDAAAATPSIPTNIKSDSISEAEKLEQCMETWDKGTHIEKRKWREICRRQLNDGR